MARRRRASPTVRAAFSFSPFFSSHTNHPPFPFTDPASPLGAGFVAAPAGKSCADACAKPFTFSEFGGTEKTALCSAVRADGTRAAGWQLLSASKPTCTIVDGSETVAKTEFACMCVGDGETQGLSRGKYGAPCTETCAKSLLGEAGRPVAVGTGEYACLAAAEQGGQNRFGSEVAGGACVGARGPTAVGTDQYSCVCAFKAAAPAPKPAVTARPTVSVASAAASEGDAAPQGETAP